MLRFGKSLGPLNRKVTEIKILRDTDPEPLARKSKKKFMARRKAYFKKVFLIQ